MTLSAVFQLLRRSLLPKLIMMWPPRLHRAGDSIGTAHTVPGGRKELNLKYRLGSY